MTHSFLLELSQLRRLVLGSGSPRRKRLLSEAGIAFDQRVSWINERRKAGEDPFRFALRMAQEKALAVAAESADDTVVLGGDTIVVLGDAILSKPGNEEEAFETLSRLSGQTHVVCTALAIADKQHLLASGTEKTTVVFNTVAAQQIHQYISTGEPMDKAGAYGIQGMGAFLVDRIDGNLDNVIGLPCTLLEALARETLQRLESGIE